MSKWTHLTTSITEEEKEQFHQYLKDYNEVNKTSFTPNKLLRVIIQELIKKYETY